jgi:hypothetical protein
MASTHMQKVSEHAQKLFLENESQVQTVAANWSIDLHLSGRIRRGLATREQVIATARACADEFSPEIKAQKSYAG